MTSSRVDIRLTISDPVLAQRFRTYLQREWGTQKGAAELVLRRALREFLERAEERSGSSLNGPKNAEH